MLESEEYGELRIEHYGWGNEELGFSYGTTPLENHWCTDEELGLEQGSDSIIYPIYPSSIPEVKIYKKKFKCIDKENLRIWGDFNSASAMQIAIKFHMCEGKAICKT